MLAITTELGLHKQLAGCAATTSIARVGELPMFSLRSVSCHLMLAAEISVSDYEAVSCLRR